MHDLVVRLNALNIGHSFWVVFEVSEYVHALLRGRCHVLDNQPPALLVAADQLHDLGREREKKGK
jgi:hypothetical protein